MSKKALGRGLEALIPHSFEQTVGGDRVLQIPLGKIVANRLQPRTRFDDENLNALSESIRHDGILQPVVVRRHGDDFELVMGERRLKAARLAGIPTVPAIVKKVEEVDSLRLALVENLQRENLGPLEVARAYRALIDTFGLAQEEMARLVGKDRSSVANTLRLLNLPGEVLPMIEDGRLSESHARTLLALSSESEQIELAKKIVANNLSVREVEAEAGESKKSKRRREDRKEKPAHLAFLEKAISSHLSTRVSIDEKRGGKGRIVIEFFNHEEFERLTTLMNLPVPR